MKTPPNLARRRAGRLLWRALAGSIVILLPACEHLPLYNKEKDSLAKSAQETYLKAEVTKTYAVQEENLKKLLQAEVDALNESAALRLDIALLRMADDRAVPDGSTSLAGWYADARMREVALGYPDSRAVLAMLDFLVEVANAEADILQQKNRINVVDGEALRTLPSCEAVKGKEANAQTWPYLADNQNAFLPRLFANYVEQCEIAVRKPPVDGGRVAAAFDELVQAESELAKRRIDAEKLAGGMRAAADALKAARAKAEENRTAVTSATEAVEKNLDEARKATDGLLEAIQVLHGEAGAEGEALIAEKNIENINTLLAALGSGRLDADGLKDNHLAKAVDQLREDIPSLAADMAALRDHAQAPPVSNLLLELQHQTIELNYAKALIRLSGLRVELLRGRLTRMMDQAGAWRSFRLSLCSYAVLSADDDHPGADCDDFEVTLEGQSDATPENPARATCKLKEEALTNCALQQTWREALNANQDNRVERELWKTIYYYAEAVEAERAAREAEFRLVDIEHREVLAAQRSAIEAWSNLVEVPIGQLAAYHASGIQPEALAEAIATVLGFAAIGAGAAQ